MRFGSGCYNVRESEVLPEPDQQIRRSILCSVLFLDNSREQFELDRHARGQDLLEKVFEHLELIEKDYFGLQFVDVPAEHEDNMQWLDASKSIRRQMQCPPYMLFFRVKFFVSEPIKLQEEYTRYHFYLQLRKDLLDGRLSCAESAAALLASYAAQSEFGDFSSDEHNDSYLDRFQFMRNQTPALLCKVAELHKLHRGQTPADAEYNFLDHAKRLDMYGVDMYHAKDGQHSAIILGAAASGVIVFQNGLRINSFPWAQITKLSFKRRQFFVSLKSEKEVETLVGFTLNSPRSCKRLWKSCIEHHTFFRLIAPPQAPPKGLFSLGSSYRFSGRTEYQTREEMKRRARIERTFHRSGSRTSYARSTVGPSSLGSQRYLASAMSCAVRDSFADPQQHAVFLNADAVAGNYAGAFVPSDPAADQCGDDAADGAQLSRSWTANRDRLHPRENGSLMGTGRTQPTVVVANGVGRETTFDSATNGRLPSSSSPVQPRTNGYGPTLHHKSPEGVRRPVVLNGCGQPTPGSQRSSVASRGSASSSVPPPGASPLHRRSPPVNGHLLPLNGFVGAGDEGLVVIRMRPDIQGRFGFNVKGGTDQNYPIIVSRVAPGSPADTCLPRLNEGDQVLAINGRDVSRHTHDQAVRFIRAARESHSHELVITVRPNVYIGEDVEEPDFRYVPVTPHVDECVPQADLLKQSLLLLKDSLASGATVLQFEQLYRRRPGLPMAAARMPENINKNRYRDVSPYDGTRVRIQNGSNGDYINANFVNMEIASSGIVNRYIAAQGPLPHTAADFWLCVWEQLCTTVVMLTATVERGRVKCEQYWPALYETRDYGALQLTCLRELDGDGTASREFSVVDKRTSEERRVTQLQYAAWPDHGVPDEPRQFCEFVADVRRHRAGSVDPLLVHCSAGIGRTGVLILMETAMGLIEANAPVYPLDIVRSMRDQRPMLVQTAIQYRFVCEAVLSAYHEQLVKPLPEYQQR